MTEASTDRLAIFPLSTVLLPGSPLTLHLFEPRYLKLMAERGTHDPIFGVVLTRDGSEVGDEPDTFAVGTAASLSIRADHPDGRCTILVKGGRRFRMIESDWTEAYMIAEVAWLIDAPASSIAPTLAQRAKTRFAAYLEDVARYLGDDEAAAAIPGAVETAISLDPAVGPFQMAAQLPLNTWERQHLLEIDEPDDRLRAVIDLVRREHQRLTTTGPMVAPSDHPGTGFSAN